MLAAVRLVSALMLAASLLVTGSAAAQPIFVYFSPEPGRGPDKATKRALERSATRAGTIVVDQSPAVPTPPEIAPFLGRAIAAYQAFRYNEAVKELDTARTHAAKHGAAGISATQLSDIYLYRALAKQGLGREAEAWEDFLGATRLAPDRHLDPVRFPPRAVESFARAKAAINSGGTTRLRFEAKPGCTKWVDARVLDIEELVLPRGEHFLRAECPGLSSFASVSTLSSEKNHVVAKHRARPEPGPAAIAAILKSERADFAVVIVVGQGDRPVVRVSARDGSGAERVIRRVPLARGAAAVLTAAAEVRGGYEKALVPTPREKRTKPRPWYRSPWPWVGLAVGAAVATAIVLPFALDSGAQTSFDVRPEGDTP